jgi:predicted esterase
MLVVMELVKAEIAAGTPSEKILIGGFSQGAAITYYTVYASEIKLGGAIALSGYLPLAPKFESRIDNTNIDTPLFAAHGTVGMYHKLCKMTSGLVSELFSYSRF